MNKLTGVLVLTMAALAPMLAEAQDLPKVSIGMSGWTGFAPLSWHRWPRRLRPIGW